MAQRTRHEMNVKTEHAAAKLLEHKAVLVAVLVAIAVACGMGLSAVSATGSSGGVEIERCGDGGARGSGESSADSDSSKSSETGTTKKTDTSEEAYVDIDGAVQTPGVYRLTTAQRISDAIDAAGGLSEDADVSTVNRASKVIDGQKIHIPRMGEVVAASGGETASSDISGAAAGASSGLVNINTAGSAELETLPGVGPSTAQSIIDDRTQNGPFASADDLMRVSGIGEKKFEKLKGKICV